MRRKGRRAGQEPTASERRVSKQRRAPNPLFPGENTLQAGRAEAEQTHLEGPGAAAGSRALAWAPTQGCGAGPGGGAGTAALLAALAPVPRASARALGRRLEREVLNPSASFSKQ